MTLYINKSIWHFGCSHHWTMMFWLTSLGIEPKSPSLPYYKYLIFRTYKKLYLFIIRHIFKGLTVTSTGQIWPILFTYGWYTRVWFVDHWVGGIYQGWVVDDWVGDIYQGVGETGWMVFIPEVGGNWVNGIYTKGCHRDNWVGATGWVLFIQWHKSTGYSWCECFLWIIWLPLWRHVKSIKSDLCKSGSKVRKDRTACCWKSPPFTKDYSHTS